jgi:hypothetical protein
MEENITVENISPDVQPERVVAVAVASMPKKRWQFHEHGLPADRCLDDRKYLS